MNPRSGGLIGGGRVARILRGGFERARLRGRQAKLTQRRDAEEHDMRQRSVRLRVTPIAILAVVTMASSAIGGSVVGGEVSSAETAMDSTDTGTEVILYYFHGTRRCNTCRTIESYAQEAVEGGFGDALGAGRLKWTVLNTDESENAHFVRDFGLVSSSLVVVRLDGGEVVRHETLQDAWTLVRDKPRFIAYVQRSVGEYLK